MLIGYRYTSLEDERYQSSQLPDPREGGRLLHGCCMCAAEEPKSNERLTSVMLGLR